MPRGGSDGSFSTDLVGQVWLAANQWAVPLSFCEAEEVAGEGRDELRGSRSSEGSCKGEGVGDEGEGKHSGPLLLRLTCEVMPTNI